MKDTRLGHDQQLKERTAARESIGTCVTPEQLLRLHTQERVSNTNIKFFRMIFTHNTKIFKVSIITCLLVNQGILLLHTSLELASS